MISGIVNINKVSGMSSSAAVSRVKHQLHTRAVGHMGTLDPIGEGVLLMGVGKGTRLFDYFLGKSKTYEAKFRFGLSADTLDITGTVDKTTDIIPSEKDIINALPSLIGTYEQLPPIYSAKSVGGVRAYKLARQGEIPELKKALITINSLELLKQTGEDEWLFRIDCSSGTYIRSLCRDLAEKCGSLAIMTAIKRTRCGDYFIEDAVNTDDLKESDIIPLDKALSALPRIDADDKYYKNISNGLPIKMDELPSTPFVLYCKNELFGIATDTESGVRIKTYLRENDKQ